MSNPINMYMCERTRVGSIPPPCAVNKDCSLINKRRVGPDPPSHAINKHTHTHPSTTKRGIGPDPSTLCQRPIISDQEEDRTRSSISCQQQTHIPINEQEGGQTRPLYLVSSMTIINDHQQTRRGSDPTPLPCIINEHQRLSTTKRGVGPDPSTLNC
jgi:hypothetical protein